MTHEVLFAPEAQQDLLQLYDYIAADSSAERARGYTDRVVALCLNLGTLPERGTRRDDLVAYIVAWNVRVGHMRAHRRTEMNTLGAAVCELRYRAVRDMNENPIFTIWSIAVIADLRPFGERVEELLARFPG